MIRLWTSLAVISNFFAADGFVNYNQKRFSQANHADFYGIRQAKGGNMPLQSTETDSDAPVKKSWSPRVDVATADTSAVPRRVYSPRSSEGSAGAALKGDGGRKWNTGDRGREGGRQYQDKRPAIQLAFPQLLTKYKVQRGKTPKKIQMEEKQEQLKASSSRSYGDYGGFDSGDTGSFRAFDPSSMGKKKSAGGDDTKRKGSEGARPKGKEERGKGKNNFDDDDDYVEDEDDEDYFGDTSAKAGLSSVPVYALKRMEQDGLSFEDMQVAVYVEYGVKVSVSALRRRIIEGSRQKRKRNGKTRRDRANRREQRYAEADAPIELPGSPIQVLELSGLMEIGAGQIIQYLMMNKGLMVTMTQTVDHEVAIEVVEAFGKEVAGAGDEDDDEDDDEDNLRFAYEREEEDEVIVSASGEQSVLEREWRPPVVTIMGHVDHGKTSLLDSIRDTRVAKGEAGGITQGVSAFRVASSSGKDITFIDTPGHAAFSDMRSRGANVTDIVVLVVAADDGIMEQTKECIAAAKRAMCPIVVAINKMDKEGADANRVLTDLTSYDILGEDLGGDVQVVQTSAKKGDGIPELLEKIQLQAELMNLKAAHDMEAQGSVIEAKVSKGLGAVSTVLVQKGTLCVGDYILAGEAWGRVRRMIADDGTTIKEAGPSTPVQVVGLNLAPNAGDILTASKTESGVREVAEARQRLARQSQGSATSSSIMATAATLVDGTIDTREIIKVPVVIKADVMGSVEALRSSLEGLVQSDEGAICMPDIVFSGVGDVTSSDVAIASVAKAKILAFNVATGNDVISAARAENVDIGYYSVVYDLLDELEETVQITLAPPPPGKLSGRATILKTFKLGKAGKVAGCEVTEGTIRTDGNVRVLRGMRNQLYLGRLQQLKVGKETVTEVPGGSECGMSFEDFQGFEEGDIIECFTSSGDLENNGTERSE
jgi:translation initiation factor IF-2